MTLDDRLKDAFQAKATTATPSPEAWDRIRSRTRTNRRARLLQAAAIAVVVPSLAVGGIMLVVHENHRGPAPAVTPTPTPTPFTGPVTIGPAPTPTPSATLGSYANAIAVVRAGNASPSENGPGDSVQLVGTHGQVLSTVVSLPGRTIQHIAWTPDRKQLYVTSVQTGSGKLACTQEAVAVDVVTHASTFLGSWTDFAFSANGAKLAAFFTDGGCGPGATAYDTLVVRDLLTGKATVYDAGTRAEWDGVGSLTWIDDGHLAFVQYGPGDGSSVRSLNLATAKTIDEATYPPLKLANGETVTRIVQVPYRMVIAVQCCLNTSAYTRFVIPDGVTGDTVEVLKVPGLSVTDMQASADGDRSRILVSPYGKATTFSFDLNGTQTYVIPGVTDAAW